MVRIGVVGYGYWGPNLVRNFAETDGAVLAAVADRSPERLARARLRYPGLRLTADATDVIDDPQIDAVALATPISTHFELARRALGAGKHVLVEKPLAPSAEQALALVSEAERRGLTLMVDHTFVYTGAVRKIRELVRSHALGDIYYYDSVRVNLGLFQSDVNVIWDLGVHDLSILDSVLPARPVAVSACAVSNIAGQPENVAYLTLLFRDRLVAHLNLNWLAPVKVRRTLIGGSEKMIDYNDVEPSEKLKVYERGVRFLHAPEDRYDLLVSYRLGDVWAPRLDMTEALAAVTRHFVECIESRKVPETDGRAGLRVVQILEAAEASARARGQAVEIRNLA